MGRKLIEKKTFGEVVTFTNPNDSVTGTVTGIHETETTNGICDVLDLVDSDGACKSVFISSNLKGYEWPDFIGKKVEIVFTKYQKNDKTKRTFKVYEVYEVE